MPQGEQSPVWNRTELSLEGNIPQVSALGVEGTLRGCGRAPGAPGPERRPERKSSGTQRPNLFLTSELKPAQEGRRRGGWGKAPWERHQTEWKHLWPPGHKPLRTNAALSPGPPWAPALEADPEWFRKSPGPGAGAGRKGAIKGEREKWGFLGNEHIWKRGGKGAGSCSHKTIWQLCVSLREGLWKLWGCRCTPKPCPPATSSWGLQWEAGGNYIWGQVFVPLFGFNLGLRIFARGRPWFQLARHTGIAVTTPGIYQRLTPARYLTCVNSQHPTVDTETWGDRFTGLPQKKS